MFAAQEAQQLLARQRARAEQAWALQPRRSAAVSLLHRGGCTLYKGSPSGYLDRREALLTLAEPGVEPCGICRPETALAEPDGARETAAPRTGSTPAQGDAPGSVRPAGCPQFLVFAP
ncbi:DUF6233 domain-containing protein [Streptomyces sp. NPDC087866]|uniref:DUF6233 domain-containing protein n=1 Tax=unclassified Streptomyces TaxID=2593676 RepID=UPI0033AD8C21